MVTDSEARVATAGFFFQRAMDEHQPGSHADRIRVARSRSVRHPGGAATIPRTRSAARHAANHAPRPKRESRPRDERPASQSLSPSFQPMVLCLARLAPRTVLPSLFKQRTPIPPLESASQFSQASLSQYQGRDAQPGTRASWPGVPSLRASLDASGPRSPFFSPVFLPLRRSIRSGGSILRRGSYRFGGGDFPFCGCPSRYPGPTRPAALPSWRRRRRVPFRARPHSTTLQRPRSPVLKSRHPSPATRETVSAQGSVDRRSGSTVEAFSIDRARSCPDPSVSSCRFSPPIGAQWDPATTGYRPEGQRADGEKRYSKQDREHQNAGTGLLSGASSGKSPGGGAALWQPTESEEQTT